MARIPANEVWHVYVIAEEGADLGPCKVGTARNVAYRLAGLQNGNWRRLTVAVSIPVRGRAMALLVEKQAHARFADTRLGRRDWFACPVADLVKFIEGFVP